MFEFLGDGRRLASYIEDNLLNIINISKVAYTDDFQNFNSKQKLFALNLSLTEKKLAMLEKESVVQRKKIEREEDTNGNAAFKKGKNYLLRLEVIPPE